VEIADFTTQRGGIADAFLLKFGKQKKQADQLFLE
jgi:hypothetical protein